MDELEDLIAKFWRKETTPAETRRLYQLLVDKDASLYSTLEAGFKQTVEDAAPTFSKEVDKRLLRKIQSSIGGKVVSMKIIRWAAATAAVVLLLAGTVSMIYINVNHAPQKYTSQVVSATEWINITATERRIYILPDSSVVKMEKGAAIQYAPSFGVAERQIKLNGEAVFDVAKDVKHPFTVLCRGIITTALGTKFRIKPSCQGKVHIDLYEGSVRVQSSDNSGDKVIMVAGQSLNVETKNFRYAFEKLHPSENISPKVSKPIIMEHGLTFKKITLDKVFEIIASRYSFNIEFQDRTALQTMHFTGTFPVTESKESVISMLCSLNNLSYKIEGNNVIILRQE